MATVEILTQKNGFWVVKTGNGGGAGESRECLGESVLVSVLRRWGVTETAIQKALFDLRRKDTASFELP